MSAAWKVSQLQPRQLTAGAPHGWVACIPGDQSSELCRLAGPQQDKIADLLFDPDVGLGLQVIRFNIGGSNTSLTATNSMRPFAAVPSMINSDGTYNFTAVGLNA